MKLKIILLLLIIVAITIFLIPRPKNASAQADSETGDTRARAVTCYGFKSDGSIVALLVDSDGKVQTG